MLFFLGTLVTPALIKATKEHIKDTGNDDFFTSLSNTAMLNSVMMLDSSLNDFNPVKSIAGKGIQWTPFSISSMTNTYKNISGMITGERDVFDTIVKAAAATKSQEPLLDFVKISTLGRKIGDNGKTE